MANTAHSKKEEMEEHYDEPEVLEEKVKKLVQMIKDSNHFIAFTGAGISTSAGIPDFRGPEGKWTREAQGLEPKKGVSTCKALPTPTHMALVKLQQIGVLKYLISQNCDGLHLRSGMTSDRISELHGNKNKEICEDCGQCYFRDYGIQKFEKRGRDRFSGSFCTRPKCGGRLLKSTICFGQNLPEKPLELAEEHGEKADLCLALGSSLSVSPACDIPDSVAINGNNLVIINLQKTQLTSKALHIFEKTDKVMKMVMEQLTDEGLDCNIPEWRLKRKILIGCQPIQAQNQLCFYARGCDYDDPSLSMTLIQKAKWKKEKRIPLEEPLKVHKENLSAEIPKNDHTFVSEFDFSRSDLNQERVIVPVELGFMGHYSEPNIKIDCDFTHAYQKEPKRVEYLCEIIYNPFTFEWTYLQKLSDVEEREIEIDPSFGKLCKQFVVNGYMKKAKLTRSSAKNLFKTNKKRLIRIAKNELQRQENKEQMKKLKKLKS